MIDPGPARQVGVLSQNTITAATNPQMANRPPPAQQTTGTMNLDLPIRSTTSRRNQDSRNYFTSYTPPSSTEAINGPVREPNPVNDRLIVGVDFGTTFSG